MDATASLIRARIIHALEVYPFISSSMLHIALGTSTSTMMWRPILMQLEAEGLVTKTEVRVQTPIGRNQVPIVYHLTKNPYNYGPPESSAA
ncbi:hypothetical protein VJJ74_07700 [Parvimonas micra]|uniref:hypothetical protein n=5 Tax=Parvimonas TaxID=543311 RepID=UPI002B48A9C6|nr:hypothetical protein [Parvimonas micra]MEB3061026.1 hypothetical protein [Parvimonas micra]